jgi:hypothetical protein
MNQNRVRLGATDNVQAHVRMTHRGDAATVGQEDRREPGGGSPRQSWRGDSAFVNQWMVSGADAATVYGVVTLLFNWTM